MIIFSPSQEHKMNIQDETLFEITPVLSNNFEPQSVLASATQEILWFKHIL
jgi:hypothetical protein